MLRASQLWSIAPRVLVVVLVLLLWGVSRGSGVPSPHDFAGLEFVERGRAGQ